MEEKITQLEKTASIKNPEVKEKPPTFFVYIFLELL
jgi:hypothetical protein